MYYSGSGYGRVSGLWGFVSTLRSILVALNKGKFLVIFIIIKPNRVTNFTNLFWHETLHFSDSSSVHHQEFIHCTLNNGVCHTGL